MLSLLKSLLITRVSCAVEFFHRTKLHKENFHLANETSDLKTEEAEESIADTTCDYDVIKSEIYDHGFTQTMSGASFTANDKSSDSIDSSTDSSETEDSSNTDGVEFLRHKDDAPSNLEHDDSSKLLISEESTNQIEADDQPVTADLTLTKTVELTENEPDPEPQPEVNVVEPEPEPESEPQTFNVNKIHIPQPMEMMRYLEEPNDIKEMSLNNFESTMDDISDAELESLEQELEDLVAIVEQDKLSSDTAVKGLEEIVEKSVAVGQTEMAETVTEIKEELPVVPTTVEPENSALAEPVAKLTENPSASNEEVEEPSEIQEVSAVSENENDQRESSASEAQEAIEPAGVDEAAAVLDPDPALSTSSTDESASIQHLPSQSNEDFSINESNSTGSLTSAPDLGRVPPYWIPDEMTNQCMQCDTKFSIIKRRHHCRACGLLLCSSCCNEKFILPYLGSEGRICKGCLETLVKNQLQQKNQPRNPNPANPMEYCSTLPPQQQVNTSALLPPTVMVPPGVLKRDNARSAERKSVIFSDGIRPGTDLDETAAASSRSSHEKPPKINMPTLNDKTNSFIPDNANELPPVLSKEVEFRYVDNNLALVQRLRQEELKFAINKNFYVTVKIVTRKSFLLRKLISMSSNPVHSFQLFAARARPSSTFQPLDFLRYDKMSC